MTVSSLQGLAHGQRDYIPQVLPVPHEAAELEPNESEELPPAIFDENVDIFFCTCSLPQAGHKTPSVLLPKTRSSKGCLHSLHTNSKIGISVPPRKV